MLSYRERFAYVVGTVLLGAAAGLVLSHQRTRRARPAPPVEQLAKTLSQAWAPYHTR